MLTTLLLACALADPQGSAPANKTADAPVFAIVFRTGPAWDAAKPPGEQPFFADHSKNLRALREEGRILIGGRFSDQGLVLVQAASQEEAQGFVDRDPSVTHGTFRAEVHRFAPFMTGCVGK
jgi:uncharacterized protein YciI